MISIPTPSSAVPGQRSKHAVDTSRTARVCRGAAAPSSLSTAAWRGLSSSSPSARFISVLSVVPYRSVKRNAILAVEPDYYRIQYVEGEPVGKRVKLFNLPSNLDEKEFMDWFTSVDIPVQSLELTDDPDLNADGIDGFMEFHTDEDARNAVAKRDGQKFNGYCIRLDFVQKKPWADGRRTRSISMSTPHQPPLLGPKAPSASSYGAGVSSSPSYGSASGAISPGSTRSTPAQSMSGTSGSGYGSSLSRSPGNGVTGSSFGSVKPTTSYDVGASGTGYGSSSSSGSSFSSTPSAPNYASGGNNSSSFGGGQPISSYGSTTTTNTQFSSSVSSNSQAAPSSSNLNNSSSQAGGSVPSYGEAQPASPTSRFGGTTQSSPRYGGTQSGQNYESATQSASKSQSSPRARSVPSARGDLSNSSYGISDAEIYERLGFGRPDNYKPGGSPPKMGSFSPPPSYTNPVPSTPRKSIYDTSGALSSQSISDIGPSYGNPSSKSGSDSTDTSVEHPSYVSSTNRSPVTLPSHSNSQTGLSSGTPSMKSGCDLTDGSMKSPPSYGSSTYGNSDVPPSYSTFGTTPSYGDPGSRSESPSTDASTEPPPSHGSSVNAKSGASPTYSISETGLSYGNPSSRSGSTSDYAFKEPAPNYGSSTYGSSAAGPSYSNSEMGSSYGNLGSSVSTPIYSSTGPPPSYGSSSYGNSDVTPGYSNSTTGPSYGDQSRKFGNAPTYARSPSHGISTYENSDAPPSYGGSTCENSDASPSYGSSTYRNSDAPPNSYGNSTYGNSDAPRSYGSFESRPSYGSPSYGSASYGRLSYGSSGYGSSRPFSLNRIFVGNLPWSADDYRLQELFSEFGTVLEARVMKDRESGRSRGFGFVSMSTAEEKQAAIDALNGKPLDGRPLRVDEASSRF